MGLRDKLKRPERVAEEETVVLACEECGEQFVVRAGIELDLVAHSWAKEYKNRGGKVYQETPPDALAVANHRHSDLLLVDKRIGEPLFLWGAYP
jgi:hypothetical protein